MIGFVRFLDSFSYMGLPDDYVIYPYIDISRVIDLDLISYEFLLGLMRVSPNYDIFSGYINRLHYIGCYLGSVFISGYSSDVRYFTGLYRLDNYYLSGPIYNWVRRYDCVYYRNGFEMISNRYLSLLLRDSLLYD